MSNESANPTLEQPFPAVPTPAYEVPFGVNEMRLTPRQWLAALIIVTIVLIATPTIWKHLERPAKSSDPGLAALDYRIPYALSKDYWLYEHRLADYTDPSSIVLL